MKQTINFYDFQQAFNSVRPDNFSYNGLKAMFEFFEQLDDDCGTETELDVIAICCDFTEYETLKEFQDNYGADNYPTFESISDHTTFISIDCEAKAFIIQDF
jgi:hypothetical protein